MSGRFAVTIVVALVVALAMLESSDAQVPMPWINVHHLYGRYYLDGYGGREGRGVTLRGTNVDLGQRELDEFRRPIDPAEYEGKCPENKPTYTAPPVCQVDAGKGKFGPSTVFTSQNDFAQMRALGFNFVRLTLNWNLLEPEPGNYSQVYLDRIAQVVGWAKEQGIYTLLDMHQDQYSRYIIGNKSLEYPPYLMAQDGGDGAPAWAVQTNGLPALAIYGVNTLNLAVLAAFDNFWNNLVIPGLPQGDAPGPGLQDHYIGAIAALAKRHTPTTPPSCSDSSSSSSCPFHNENAVVGYEIMNEPQPGFDFDFVGFSSNKLYPFYARVIQAITGVRDGLPTCPASQPTGSGCAYPSLGLNDTHVFFFEPMAIRNTFDFSIQDSVPFTTYPNIAFAPHVYTHVFTIDQALGLPNNNTIYPPSYDFAYTTAAYEAFAMNAAMLVTEFGGLADFDNITLRGTIEAQDRAVVGSAMWEWKTNMGNNVSGLTDLWTVYAGPVMINGTMQQNGPILANRERILSRAYSPLFLGQVLATTYNSDDGSYYLEADVLATDTLGKTYAWVPPAAKGEIAVNGNIVFYVHDCPDGSRLVEIDRTGDLALTLIVSPTPVSEESKKPAALDDHHRRSKAAQLPPKGKRAEEMLSMEGMQHVKTTLGAYLALGEALASVRGHPELVSALSALLKSPELAPLRRLAGTNRR